ncbi:TolC family protein [Gangjinia marincola]|uniref:TolC family protein n=1 Tax=Gangjinia marincola TaxID=578463 RepID=A0ABP3XQ51_9FLAO
MKRQTNHILFIGILLSCLVSFGQAEILTKEEAFRLMLKNNFSIEIAENNTEIAENNAGILNSGYLPNLTGLGSAGYEKRTTDVDFPPDSERDDFTLENAETQSYNASINASYLLFDGLGRLYNFKRLQELYALSELQARETAEVTGLQLFSVYYDVARLTENVEVFKETLNTSRDRITRAQYRFEYGQANKLEVLNAQVDVANDSINLLNAIQSLGNAKRDLNLVLSRDLMEEFEVDTLVNFTSKLVIDAYLVAPLQKNVRYMQSEQNIKINEYDLKISRSGYFPRIDLSGSYGWNQNRNPPNPLFGQPPNINENETLSAGINLTWNIFDGGATVNRERNAKITLQNQEVTKKQVEQEVLRDIKNAEANYLSRLIVFDIQKKNVATAKNNFERTQEVYKLGRATSIEYRQAQINYLNARTNRNAAKYDAKLAELQLLQLTGEILNTKF